MTRRRAAVPGVLLAALLVSGSAACARLPPAPPAPVPAVPSAPVPAPAPVDGVPTQVTAYVEAVRRQDAAAVAAAFVPGGTVIDVRRRIAGRAEIQEWAQREVVGGTLEVLGTDQAAPGHVRLLVHWAPAGSAGWRAYYTFDYADAGITSADLQYA